MTLWIAYFTRYINLPIDSYRANLKTECINRIFQNIIKHTMHHQKYVWSHWDSTCTKKYRTHQYLMIILIVLTSSCGNKTLRAPTYIQINKIELQYNDIQRAGNGGTAISDAWVFDNDQLLGVFELPTTIALSAEGIHEITVRQGLKLMEYRLHESPTPFILYGKKNSPYSL